VAPTKKANPPNWTNNWNLDSAPSDRDDQLRDYVHPVPTTIYAYRFRARDQHLPFVNRHRRRATLPITLLSAVPGIGNLNDHNRHATAGEKASNSVTTAAWYHVLRGPDSSDTKNFGLRRQHLYHEMGERQHHELSWRRRLHPGNSPARPRLVDLGRATPTSNIRQAIEYRGISNANSSLLGVCRGPAQPVPGTVALRYCGGADTLNQIPIKRPARGVSQGSGHPGLPPSHHRSDS